eukprot:CAMPEP_0182585864 /NCGR_PEP_ID=MMETSP1324-20130603/61331_1 /TAXON_ID=236786 /ORGANISM="Florenciella sp., Strain RCC1587" /LENGTH=86 /DNA_ID=CAMNT_0024802699 /DNA_START=235 /DNA_END=497 /DNA_ORIENTATION=+
MRPAVLEVLEKEVTAETAVVWSEAGLVRELLVVAACEKGANTPQKDDGSVHGEPSGSAAGEAWSVSAAVVAVMPGQIDSAWSLGKV